MKTTSLEILEKAKLPSEQARAILQIVEMEIADRHDGLASRGDLHAVELRLELKIEQLRTEMRVLGTKLIVWIFGIFVAFAGLLLTVLNHRP